MPGDGRGEPAPRRGRQGTTRPPRGHAAFGHVQWLPALVMAICAVVGGYAGVSVVRRLNGRVLRNVIVVWGVIEGVILPLR